MSKTINFITDKEIVLNDKNDLLSTKIYADNLRDVILNIPANTDASFTIGLFGEWGSGKSSIINTVKSVLEYESNNKYKFIIYDAWKYSNDSFRRTLLLKLQEDLKFDRTKLLNSFYLNESEDVEIKKKFNLGYCIFVALLSLVALWLIFATDLPVDFKITIPVLLSLVGFVAAFFQKAFDEFKVNIQKPHLFAPEQFEECFNEMTRKALIQYSALIKIHKWVKGDRHLKDIKRLIIIIDNIDRCHKELAYDLLTNIKNFLGKNKDIIFIIPVDDEALKRHIESTNNENNAQEASEFLRKFFNVVIRLKPLKGYDIYSFAKKINDKYSLGFSPDTIDVIGKEYASNPRRIIQFYNNLLAEINNYDIDFIKENETAISKMLILKEEWPAYFKKLCRNPYLLDNPNDEIKDIIHNDNLLSSFLNKTKSITQGIDPKALSKIILNEDDLSDLPDQVISSINNLGYEEIHSFTSDNMEKLSLVTDYLIEALKSFIENNRNMSALHNFQILLSLNDKKAFDKSANRRIQNEISSYLPELLKNGSESNSLLVKYSETLHKQNITYLKDYLINTVNNEYASKAKYEEITDVQKDIFMNMVTTYDDAKSLEKLITTFQMDYENNETSMSNIKIKPENLKYIISDNLLKYLAGNVKAINGEDSALTDLIYLSKHIKITPTSLEHIFLNVNTIHSNYTDQPYETILGVISSLNRILENITANRTLKWKYFDYFYKAVFAERAVSGTPVQLMKEIIKSNDALDICIDFIFHVYRITANEVSSLNELKELYSSKYAKPKIKSMMFKLKDEHNYSLSPLLDIILTDNVYDEDSLELLKYVLTHKNKEKHILSVEKLIIKLDELLNLTIGENINPAIAPFLESLLNSNRINNNLIELITKKSKDDILALTEKLQQLAFDYICKDNRLLTEYKNEQELLMAIAQSGTPTHIKALTNVLIEKFMHNEHDPAFQIFDNVSKFSKSDKAKLTLTLKDLVDDKDIGKYTKKALDKIDGNLKTKSIFDSDDEQPASEPAEE